MYTVSPGSGYQPPPKHLFTSRDILNMATKIANGMRYLADRKVCTWYASGELEASFVIHIASWSQLECIPLDKFVRIIHVMVFFLPPVDCS